MKTIWVLAKNRHTAIEALRKSLKDRLEESEFIDFKFIATPHCIEDRVENFWWFRAGKKTQPQRT